MLNSLSHRKAHLIDRLPVHVDERQKMAPGAGKEHRARGGSTNIAPVKQQPICCDFPRYMHSKSLSVQRNIRIERKNTASDRIADMRTAALRWR